MYNRLAEFLDINNILVQNQYGFREKYSTFMASLKLVDDLSEELDKYNYSIGVFRDLSNAFNTIDHNVLFNKTFLIWH